MSAITLPGIPDSCEVQIPLIHPGFRGLIALGPTVWERDVLHACCHTLQTETFSVNDTACLQTAACKVDECTMNDPTVACVVLQKKEWAVNGTFGCLEGYRENKAGNLKKIGSMWAVLAAVMMGVASFGAL
ncbi:Nn.00g111330.m01.CDS01 [Neocucurbitaria sp. VM-36]